MSAQNNSQAKLDKPISRYSNFKKPKNFETELQQLNKEMYYDKEQNYYIIPTDKFACKQPEFDEDKQMFGMQAEAHRITLGMKPNDPIVILRSSLHLRDLYNVCTSFASNPVSFMQNPLDTLPSLEQQLFEDRLIYDLTYLHPFLTFVYSTKLSEFILVFNIPLPLDLKPSSPSNTSTSSLPATLSYLSNCLPSVQQLSRFYPKASRPFVCVNSFPERISSSPTSSSLSPSTSSSSTPLSLPLSLSCSNIKCDNNVFNHNSRKGSDEKEFLRCTQCKLVYYCCKECQKEDWGRHKRFCEMKKEVDNNTFTPLPPPPQDIKEILEGKKGLSSLHTDTFEPSSSSSSSDFSSITSSSSPMLKEQNKDEKKVEKRKGTDGPVLKLEL